MSPPIQNPRSRTNLLIVLGLIVLPLLAFGGALRHGFVDWDDQEQLSRNPDFNPPTAARIAKYWRHPHMHLYLPLTYSAWGAIASVAYHPKASDHGIHLDARYFHAANLLCHIFSTMLVLAILLELGLARIPSAIGAAVFAIHPVMVEPVAWASAFYTVLSGMLSLLAVWLYLRHARCELTGRPATIRGAIHRSLDDAHAISAPPSKLMRWTWLGLAGAAFILAMLAKPSAVVVPIICGIVDWLLIGRPMRRIIPPVVAGLLLAVPIMMIANRAQSASTVPILPAGDRLIVAADAIAFYIGKLAWPAHFAADYGRSPPWLLHSPQRFWTWIIPLALLIGAIAAWRRRSNWPLAALAVFVAGLGVYLGLARFEYQYYSTVADRYLYVSMLGVAMVIGWLAGRHRRGPICIVFAVLIAALTLRSAMQTRIWRDSRALFNHTLAINPRSIVANNVIAFLDASQGDYPAAIAHYQTSLKTDDHNATTHYNFANTLRATGDNAGAAAQYRQSLSIDPRQPRAWNNLGTVLAMTGDRSGAREAFVNALRIDPDYADARQNLEKVQARP